MRFQSDFAGSHKRFGDSAILRQRTTSDIPRDSHVQKWNPCMISKG